jgi:hypothetical protein
MEEKSVDFHLQQALSHLEIAIKQSVSLILEHREDKAAIGKRWEQFLGTFLNLVREKGKQSRSNLLSLISFPRIR